MKTLILMRHGTAKTTGASTDAARELNDIGRAEAMDSANYLLSNGFIPDCILSSHAKRAIQTATIIADILGYDPKKIITERAIYYTDEDEVLEVIQQQSDVYNKILMVGHNPTISNIARRFYLPLYQSMPPATVAIFRADTEQWLAWGNEPVEMLGIRVPGDGTL